MSDFSHEISNWATGVIQSVEGDKIADDALMVAKNTQFLKQSTGQAALGTRPGLRLCTTLLNGTTPVNTKHMVSYPYPASNNVAYTRYMAIIDDQGRLRYKEPDDSWDGLVLTPPGGYPSQASAIPPDNVDEIDSTVMNGRLFLIGGPVRRTLKGKTYQPFGLDAPIASVTVVTGASVGGYPTPVMPADTYDVYGTAYDSETGAESVPTYFGAFAVPSGSILRVQFTNTFLSDKCRVYIRRQSTQANAYLVVNPKTSSGGLIASDGNIPSSVAFGYIDSSAAEIQDYIIQVPSLTENSALSPEAVYVSTFGRRLVAASRRKLFYSKLDQPDSFPPQNFEIVDIGNGSEIVGIMPTDDELLLIFTSTGVWGLFGIDPQYWVLKPISTSIGCVGRKSITKFEGGVAWWSPQIGPVIMRGTEIEKIGLDRLGSDFLDQISSFNYNKICGAWDPYHRLILWSVPTGMSQTNTILLPYSYEQNSWCATEWDPFDIPFMCQGWNANGQPRLFVMDNYYRLYYFDSLVQFDGIDPTMGTVTGTTPLGTGSTTVTIAGTGWYSTSSGFGGSTANMIGQRITFLNQSSEVIGRRMITTNTTTSLTWDLPVDGLLPSCTYYISTPMVEIQTKQFDGGQAFLRKRYDRVFVHYYNQDVNVGLRVYYELNQANQTKTYLTVVNPNAAQTATLDATWAVPVTTNVPFIKKRLALFKNGHMLRFVFQQAKPQQMVISRLTVLGRMLSDRYYA